MNPPSLLSPSGPHPSSEEENQLLAMNSMDASRQKMPIPQHLHEQQKQSEEGLSRVATGDDQAPPEMPPKDNVYLNEAVEQSEATGLDPRMAGLLGGVASMLRTSGWQSQPLSYGQRLGYALPAGMDAYYQQSSANAESAEALRKQEEHEQTLAATQVQEETFFIALNSARKPNGQKLHQREREQLRGLFRTNPEKAYELLEKLTGKKEKKVKSVSDAQITDSKSPNFGKMGRKITYDNGDSDWQKETDGSYTLAGSVSEVEKEASKDKRFQAKHQLEQNKFGHTTEQDALHNELKERVFQRDTKESEEAHILRVKKFHEDLKQNGIRNGYTLQQIENQVLQFQESMKQKGFHFTQEMDLKRELFNFRKDSWKTDYEYQIGKDNKNHEQRLAEFSHKIIQDGIRNGFTERQIQNDVEQFKESIGFQKQKYETTQELKERIFDQQVETDIRDFNERIKQFSVSQTFKESEAGRQQENFDRGHQQGIVEHLALIKQRGIQNGHADEKIALAQKKFLESQRQFEGSMNFKQMVQDSNEEYRAVKIAQDLRDFTYQKGRDEKGDIRKDKEWERELEKERQRLIQQEVGNARWEKDYDLRKLKIESSIKNQELKLATEGNQAPRTLTGEAAKDWASDPENNFPVNLENQKGTPVIRINKHGQFESINYIDGSKYTEKQHASISRIQEKWVSNTNYKGAAKITRLAKSLKALADEGTGVAEFAMVYKFMKSLDETSTVLASEFRGASNAGLSAIRALMRWGDQKMKGTMLDSTQQRHIVEAVRKVAYQRLNSINEERLAAIKVGQGQNISQEDLEAVMPNPLQDYFNNNPLTEEERERYDGIISGDVSKETRKNKTSASIAAGL